MSRKALIIGNNNYSKSKLQNCVNDATKLTETLRNVSFTVVLMSNLASDDLYKCIREFSKSIEQNDFIIFYFAGHGVQWGDQNFLLPCDNDKIENGNDMQRYAINAQKIVNEMAKMNPHVVVVLLDCCRTYWVPSEGRTIDQLIGGLGQMEAPPGTLIAFACAPGKTTPDRLSDMEGGIFTKCLLKHITTPNTDVDVILRRVAKNVSKETSYQQQPFRVSSIVEEDVCIVLEVKETKPRKTTHVAITEPKSKKFKGATESNEAANYDLYSDAFLPSTHGKMLALSVVNGLKFIPEYLFNHMKKKFKQTNGDDSLDYLDNYDDSVDDDGSVNGSFDDLVGDDDYTVNGSVDSENSVDDLVDDDDYTVNGSVDGENSFDNDDTINGLDDDENSFEGSVDNDDTTNGLDDDENSFEGSVDNDDTINGLYDDDDSVDNE